MDFNLSTIGSYISLGILGFVALSALCALVFGFKRGFSKSLLRLITVAIAAVGAFLVAASLSTAVANAVADKGLVEIIKGIEDKTGAFIDDPAIYDLIDSFDKDTAAMVISLIVSIVIVPIVFILLFYVFKLVTLLIFWLLSAMTGLNRKHKNFISRVLGVLIAAVQGVIIAGVVLLPVAGFASLADEATQNMIDASEDEESAKSIIDFRENILNDILENPVISVILDAGGKDLFKTMTSVEYEGDKFSAYDEMLVLTDIYVDVTGVSSWENPTEDDNKRVEALGDKIADNYFTSTVVSGILSGFSTAIENETLVVSMDEPLGSLFKSMISVFTTSTRDNLKDDLNTITHVYSILGKYEVLNSFDDSDKLRTALLTKHSDGETEKTVIDYVVDELYKNPRTAPVVNSLTEISIKVMCEQMGLDEDAAEIYENVKGGVKDVLAKNEADYATREEYVEDISKDLDATLKENNIEVDEATLNNMSEYIADNYSDKDMENLTDEDINKAILSYYNAYAEANPDATLPEGVIPQE